MKIVNIKKIKKDDSDDEKEVEEPALVDNRRLSKGGVDTGEERPTADRRVATKEHLTLGPKSQWGKFQCGSSANLGVVTIKKNLRGLASVLSYINHAHLSLSTSSAT